MIGDHASSRMAEGHGPSCQQVAKRSIRSSVRLGVTESASGENRSVTNWAWATPLVSFAVGLIGGAILLWNNRQRPHDVLKTYVEIYNNLPDGEIKDRLWSEIAERLRVLTTPRESGRTHEVPIQSELGPMPLGLRLFMGIAGLLTVAAPVVGAMSTLNWAQMMVASALILLIASIIVPLIEVAYHLIKRSLGHRKSDAPTARSSSGLTSE